MDEQIFGKVKEFIIRHRWKYKFPLERKTQMEKQLGIYGDDATEIMLVYGKEFNVDVSKFMAASYFSGEGFSLFGKDEKTKELTLGDLEKGVIAGRLDEEVINS